jgi:ADP-ribose pyrophosphatase YjhB (NUDIX family)
MEETGLFVKVLGITAVLERVYRDAAENIPYHYVLIDFACDYIAGEVTPASDITAAQFVSREKLQDIPLASLTSQVIERAWEQKQTGAFLPLII